MTINNLAMTTEALVLNTRVADGRGVSSTGDAKVAASDGSTILSNAVVAALSVVGVELLVLAWVRWRFFGANYLASLGWICLAATMIVVISAALGTAA